MILTAKNKLQTQVIINLPVSKSICNRLLILNAISNGKIKLNRYSNANDSVVLKNILANNSNTKIDVEDAGTAMRFLTAYFAFSGKSVTIKGTQRMHKRPIKPLVDTLNQMGAKITYQNKEGYPPLNINPASSLNTTPISIDASISSQFVSALLLIMPKFDKEINLILKGEIISRPYIEMTLKLLNDIGIETKFNEDSIRLKKQKISNQTINLETDWSASSYFYALFVLLKNDQIILTGLNENSVQGDSVLINWFETYFGILTQFNEKGVILKKKKHTLPAYLELDFSPYPDIAQTMIVLCCCLGIKIKATGLKTLTIKETNRIEALKIELKKFQIKVDSTNDQLVVSGKIKESTEMIKIETYKDHRMAMAFSIISTIRPLTIEKSTVVEKSFPNFFEELNQLVNIQKT